MKLLWINLVCGSPQNPFKEKKNLMPEYDRLRMVELAIEDRTNMLASNVEFSLPKPSYTIDTLTHLADTYRGYNFSILMGQDNLQHFHKWKKHEAIIKYYQLYVYPRAGSQKSQWDEHTQVTFFEAPLLNISASYIRKLLGQGKSIRYLVPQKVEQELV